MSKKEQAQGKSKMVPLPSQGIVPERDVYTTPALECRHLGIDFGGLHAVEDFNITVGKTEIAGLIGPNGAGKTTVFNLLTKVYQPTRGTILIDGQDTAGLNPVKVNQLGVARTFQNIRLFSTLSVEDNVRAGLHNQVKCGVISAIFRLPRHWKCERESHERALELLDVFGMADYANDIAGSLPYGAQRRLEIVRALATNPKLLLLDEPDGKTSQLWDYLGYPYPEGRQQAGDFFFNKPQINEIYHVGFMNSTACAFQAYVEDKTPEFEEDKAKHKGAK